MRTAGLLLLTILFPAFACMPVGTAHAAELVNINTANATTLDGLPYISFTVATAIVDYRTAHGPFVRIEDIMNVTGIKSGIFSNIQSLITVGDTSAQSVSDSTTSSTPESVASTTSAVIFSSSSGPPEYLPIPTLRIVTNGTHIVSSGADVPFTAVVYDNKSNKRDDAVVTWSFGDGMRRTGASVYHAYYNPGEYLAIVHATTSDGGDTQNEILMTVKDASIKITSVSPRGIALTNNDSRTLNVSLWRLSMGGQEFKIPEDTQILAGRTILFPSQVIELPTASSASLLYPSGEIAALYPPVTQPSSGAVSYKKVQPVEPIISVTKNVPEYAEAVGAPAPVSNKETGAGAASTTAENGTAAVVNSRTAGIFKSPWTLGFLSVLVLAGGAFIFL